MCKFNVDFFRHRLFLRILLARMYSSSAIACVDWTRTLIFFLVWNKIPFFFSRFLLILLSATQKKESSWIEEQTSASSAVAYLDWTRIPFFSCLKLKYLFFFSFATDIAVRNKKKTNQQLALFVCHFWFPTEKHFFFWQFLVTLIPATLWKKIPRSLSLFFWQKKENFNDIQFV